MGLAAGEVEEVGADLLADRTALGNPRFEQTVGEDDVAGEAAHGYGNRSGCVSGSGGQQAALRPGAGAADRERQPLEGLVPGGKITAAEKFRPGVAHTGYVDRFVVLHNQFASCGIIGWFRLIPGKSRCRFEAPDPPRLFPCSSGIADGPHPPRRPGRVRKGRFAALFCGVHSPVLGVVIFH